MSKIKYSSLEEAWGSTINPHKNNIHFENKEKELNDNPLRTPNLNYECKNNIPKIENDYYLNTRPKKRYDEMFNNMDEDSKDLYSFIDRLNLTEKNRNLLSNKIKKVYDNIKNDLSTTNNSSENYNNYEKYSNNNIEKFENPYYNLRHENKNTDILFLILLGVFLIFIIDKK